MGEKQYKPVLIDTVKAAVDLPKQKFITFNGNICTAGAKAYGVSDVEISKDQFAPVGVLGVFLVQTGGAITQGSAVTSDANGKAVTVATDNAINGYALDSASGADEVIRIVRGI